MSRATDAARRVRLVPVAELEDEPPSQDSIDRRAARENNGFWAPCTGCCDLGEAGANAKLYPEHPTHGIPVGEGCAECNYRGIVLVPVEPAWRRDDEATVDLLGPAFFSMEDALSRRSDLDVETLGEACRLVCVAMFGARGDA